jgi:hypothetical protein
MTTALTLSPSLAVMDHLAQRVAEHGVDVDRALVVEVVRAASVTGAPAVLADVVTDPREPAVARQRALGSLLAHLARHHESLPVEGTASRSSTWPAHAA